MCVEQPYSESLVVSEHVHEHVHEMWPSVCVCWSYAQQYKHCQTVTESNVSVYVCADDTMCESELEEESKSKSDEHSSFIYMNLTTDITSFAHTLKSHQFMSSYYFCLVIDMENTETESESGFFLSCVKVTLSVALLATINDC